MSGWPWRVVVIVLMATAGPSSAQARGGGSFGGRAGFSGSRSYSTGRTGFSSSASSSPHSSTSYSTGYAQHNYHSNYGGNYGGGYRGGYAGGYGYGGGYGGSDYFPGGFGNLLILLLIVAVVAIAWFAYRSRRRLNVDGVSEEGTPEGKAHVARLQLALGRTAGLRLQKRLDELAESGDTASTTGLAALLETTALALLRDQDSIDQAALVVQGPLSLDGGEQRFNQIVLQERSRYDRDRIRNVDGKVGRDGPADPESMQALESLVISIVVAAKTSFGTREITTREQVLAALQEFGALGAVSLLALQVIWIPADPTDSMTSEDVNTLFPELLSL